MPIEPPLTDRQAEDLIQAIHGVVNRIEELDGLIVDLAQTDGGEGDPRDVLMRAQAKRLIAAARQLDAVARLYQEER